MSSYHSPLRLLVGVLAVPLLLTSCDSTHPNTVTGEVYVQGVVTSDAGYASPGIDGGSAIEGAVVTAEEILAGGVLGFLWGETTTDMESEYLLTMQPTGNAIVLTAETGSFRGAVMLEEGLASGPVAGGIIQAPPMSLESTAEADVFVQGRRMSPHILVADASALVGIRAGEALLEGSTNVAKLATAAVTGSQTELEFARRIGASDMIISSARDERREAFSAFRAEVAAAPTIEARKVALNTFLDRYGRAFAHVGLSMQRQGRVSIAAYGAANRFSGVSHPRARFATVERSLEIAALNAARAVEDAFLAAGAPSGRVATLSHARGSLMASVRASMSIDNVYAALDVYRGVVRLELAGELNQPVDVIDDAFASLAIPRASLAVGIADAADFHALSDAYISYYSAAREAIRAVLGEDANLAVEVIPLIFAFGS